MFDRSTSILFRLEQEELAEKKKQEELNKKVVQTNDFYIRLDKAMRRTYGVSIKYYDGQYVNDAVAPARRVDYEMDVLIAPHQEINHQYWISMEKKNLFINRHEPDLVAEELAALFMEALNPMCVLVDKYNNILNGVTNHQEILKNWTKTKIKILEKYEGELTDKLIEKAEKRLQHSSQILFLLEKDMFWKAFFNPIYGIYAEQLQREQLFDFPIRHNKRTLFEGIQQVQKYKTDYNTYKIEFNSEEINNDLVKYVYDIEMSSGLIKYMYFDWYLNGLKQMRFSAYQTGEDRLDIPALDIEVMETPKKKKRSFWNFWGD